ncbi:MAG TPA: L-threonylcarbamoyladenylate synthase [Elusimicrobiota bacterium]|nr:L-threonylcarbamoyladenylate synthase [Elusimicrobiota bacterium]
MSVTRHYVLKTVSNRRGAVQESARILSEGGLVVVPTDTVYGIAAHAFRREAIERIYRLKDRHHRKPIPFLVQHPDQIRCLVHDIPVRLSPLLKKYWPGPLTVVFRASAMGQWITGGKETIAVRIPKHSVVTDLIRRIGVPLACTSANMSGRVAHIDVPSLRREFDGKVDAVLDDGPCAIGCESSVLDVSHYPWTLLREGALTKKVLNRYA